MNYRKKLNPDQYNLTSFVRYATREEAEKAAEAMNGFEFNKHHLIVDLADNKQHDNKRAVFVGNLPLSKFHPRILIYSMESSNVNVQ